MVLVNFNVSSKNNDTIVIQSISMNNHAIPTGKHYLYIALFCSISYHFVMMRLVSISLRFQALKSM